MATLYLKPVGRSIGTSPRKRGNYEVDSLLKGLSIDGKTGQTNPKPNEEGRLIPLLYFFLLLVRASCALLLPGYVHPDEHFQSVEIVAGDLLGLDTFRTWEFDPGAPIRSVGPLYAVLGPFFAAASGLNATLAFFGISTLPEGLAAFLLSRLAFFLLSLTIDAAVFRILRPSKSAWRALSLLASSGTMLVYMVRPFTNSIEACIVAWCLVLVCELEADSAFLGRKSFQLGALVAFGLFTRISFIPFAAVFGFGYLAALRRRWLSGLDISKLLFVAFEAFLGLSLASTALVVGDTIYYSQYTLAESGNPLTFGQLLAALVLDPMGTYSRLSLSMDPVIAPLNAFWYNWDPANLAIHGIHPRYLHILVNMPIVFGPLCLFGLWKAIFGKESWSFAQGLSAACVAVPLAALSIVPHQEPRFLVSLVAPLVAFVHARRQKPPQTGTSSRSGARLAFWLPHLFHALLLTFVLGYLHQGGIVPSLLWIGRTQTHTPILIANWKTYMPPRYLLSSLAVKGEGRAHAEVHDLMGTAADEVPGVLAYLAHDSLRRGNGARALFLAPAYAPFVFNETIEGARLVPLQTFRPHLNLDDAEDLVKWARSGQVNGNKVDGILETIFGLKVWEVVATD